jgi:Uma2 family endonuclease
MLEEVVVPMFAEARRSESFDPLVDLDGMWTTDLAERYLPIQGVPPAKYEGVDGQLILSPYEAGPNVYAADELRTLVKPAVRVAGLRLYTTVNLRLDYQRWIQPDFTVVRKPIAGTWTDAADVVLTGEFVSPSSRKRDKIDKPALCAAAGIAYYLTGQVSLTDEDATVAMWRLTENGYQLVAKASAGERFEVDEPFKMSFDPIELLDL